MPGRGSTPHKAERSEIFISYSRRDAAWLERLRVHLEPLIQRDRLEIWHDGRIQPGERWRDELHHAVARARVAVLLVSPDYLASPFIASEELPPILRAAQSDGLRVFWIPVRASIVDKTELGTMQAAQPADKPLAGLRGPAIDRALADIARAIVEVFEVATDSEAMASTSIDVETRDGVTTVPFTGEQMTVGRAIGNDVALVDDEASRWHAVFERFGARWYIRDLSSRNGTLVNGERVGTERRLQSGDRILIGRTAIVFETDAPPIEADTTRAGHAPPELTAAERNVLVEMARPLASGRSSAEPATDDEVSRALGLTVGEVGDHVARLMSAFAVAQGPARRSRLADEAIRTGAIDAAALHDHSTTAG